jgi:hypothetical protein
MIDKGEIMVSAMSRVEKELKKIGFKVMDSHIFRDRGYGYVRGIPNDGKDNKKEIDIAVEMVGLAPIEGQTMKKIAFNLKERDYEFNKDGELTELAQDFYVIASVGKKESSFYVYSKDEMQNAIESGVTANLVKSQLSKTASSMSMYDLELSNFTKSEYENKWSKLHSK